MAFDYTGGVSPQTSESNSNDYIGSVVHKNPETISSISREYEGRPIHHLSGSEQFDYTGSSPKPTQDAESFDYTGSSPKPKTDDSQGMDYSGIDITKMSKEELIDLRDRLSTQVEKGKSHGIGM